VSDTPLQKVLKELESLDLVGLVTEIRGSGAVIRYAPNFDVHLMLERDGRRTAYFESAPSAITTADKLSIRLIQLALDTCKDWIEGGDK
jgi:hypothetical protein